MVGRGSVVVNAEYLERSMWRRARWLVISPHPDDETIGVGSLVAQSAALGLLGGVFYLNDGTGSHPEGTTGLASARRKEARQALRRLAGRSVSMHWLGWQDARPPARSSLAFRNDAARLGGLMRRKAIDAVAVTDPSESHCDHVAAYFLARAAIGTSCRSISLFTYHVWSDPTSDATRRIRTRPMAAGLRRRALQAHRSQLSPAFGEGFRLPAAMRSMAGVDTLYLRNGKR